MYKKLSKEEKKKVRIQFAKSKKGAELLPILNRLVLEGVSSLICGVIILIISIIKNLSWPFYLLDILCFLGGIVFLVSQAKIRFNQYSIMASKMKK